MGELSFPSPACIESHISQINATLSSYAIKIGGHTKRSVAKGFRSVWVEMDIVMKDIRK